MKIPEPARLLPIATIATSLLLLFSYPIKCALLSGSAAGIQFALGLVSLLVLLPLIVCEALTVLEITRSPHLPNRSFLFLSNSLAIVVGALAEIMFLLARTTPCL